MPHTLELSLQLRREDYERLNTDFYVYAERTRLNLQHYKSVNKKKTREKR